MILIYIVVSIVAGVVTFKLLGSTGFYLALVLSPVVGGLVIGLLALVQYYRIPQGTRSKATKSRDGLSRL